MTNSDIIAIIAVSMTGITSIATLAFGYLTARMNIRAERSKISFEKRLEAFRDIYSAITKRNIVIDNWYAIFYLKERGIVSKRSKTEMFSEEYNISEIFNDIYASNRVYLPPHIDKLVQAYADASGDCASSLLISEDINDKLRYQKDLVSTSTLNIVNAMHAFIGFE